MVAQKMTRYSDDSTLLPEGFVPSERDVICSWARQNHEHAGNKRFRELISQYSTQYMKATTKLDKTEVIAAVIKKVRSDSPGGGGFVKKDFHNGRWYEIGDEKARDKVGHAMRKAAELCHKQNGGESGSKKRSKAAASIKKMKKQAKLQQHRESSDSERGEEHSKQQVWGQTTSACGHKMSTPQQSPRLPAQNSSCSLQWVGRSKADLAFPPMSFDMPGALSPLRSYGLSSVLGGVLQPRLPSLDNSFLIDRAISDRLLLQRIGLQHQPSLGATPYLSLVESEKRLLGI